MNYNRDLNIGRLKMENTFALIDQFIQNRIKAFKIEIENSDLFINLAMENSEKSATIESCVMELCHGSCHYLTIGLADLFEIKKCALITTESGFPVHSALISNGLFLDGNGVHDEQNVLSFWEGVVKEKCKFKIIEIEELCVFAGYEEDSVQMVIEDFEIVANFMLENIELLT